MNLEEIRKKYNLSLILMHGSQVSGKTHSESDTDIAFVRQNDSLKVNFLELLADLSKLLKKDKIDLVDITHANPLLLQKVIIKSKLLAGDKSNYDRLSLEAFHKYCDYKYFLKIHNYSYQNQQD